MSEDQTVTQADERAADEWYPDRSSPMHRKLAKLLARHRAAHSGEGRSNGAGKALSGLEWTEDGLSLRTPYDGDVDGEGRHIVVGGDLIVTFDDSEIADKYRARILAALSAPQGKVERLTRALRDAHAGDYAKAILEQLTAQFGLTFEQLNGRTVGRVNRFHTGGPVNFRPNVDDYVHPGVRELRDRGERLARRAMDVYRREYASICAVYLIGYDPQRLLEDKR